MKKITLSDLLKSASFLETKKSVFFDSLTNEEKIEYLESISNLDEITLTKTFEKKANGLTAAERKAAIAAITVRIESNKVATAAITAKMISNPDEIPALIEQLNEINTNNANDIQELNNINNTSEKSEATVKVKKTFNYSSLTTNADKLTALRLANPDVKNDTEIEIDVFNGDNVVEFIKLVKELDLDQFCKDAEQIRIDRERARAEREARESKKNAQSEQSQK